MALMKKYSGILGIIILTALPVLFWFLFISSSFNFLGFTNILRSLGKISGLAGMALFSINLILSARLKSLENYFEGLGRIYINHHLIGTIAFILLLFHPLFLAIQYIPISVVAAAQFFLPSLSQYDIILGMSSLAVMIILLVITYYARIKYHIWKWTHKFLGLAFFLGGLHMLFVSSDVSNNLILRWYMIILAVLGLASYAYRAVLGRAMVKKTEYVVGEIRNLNGLVTEIVMEPKNRGINFMAGQFIFINFNVF